MVSRPRAFISQRMNKYNETDSLHPFRALFVHEASIIIFSAGNGFPDFPQVPTHRCTYRHDCLYRTFPQFPSLSFIRSECTRKTFPRCTIVIYTIVTDISITFRIPGYRRKPITHPSTWLSGRRSDLYWHEYYRTEQDISYSKREPSSRPRNENVEHTTSVRERRRGQMSFLRVRARAHWRTLKQMNLGIEHQDPMREGFG